MVKSTVALIILLITFIIFLIDKFPASMVSVAAAFVMAYAGCMSFDEAVVGFSSSAALMIMGSGFLEAAFSESGLAKKITKFILRLDGFTEKQFVIVIVVLGAVITAFLNGMIVMALFMPLIESISRETNGKITKKNTYLPLGIAAVFGGTITVAGATSMINASSCLKESYYGRELYFFEPMILGLPVTLVYILVLVFLGTRLQEKVFDFPEVYVEGVHESGNGAVSIEEKVPIWKQWLVIAVMTGCTIGYISGLNYGVVSLTGACLVVLTKCVDIKTATRSVNWGVYFIVAGTLGIAKGIEVSGAGVVIANSIYHVFNVFGKSAFIYCVMVLIMCTLISNVMSNNVAVGICLPIALSIAQRLNADALPFVLCCAVGSNLSVATPICTAAITITASAGYHFKHFMKFGGLFNIIAVVVASIALKLAFFL